MADYLIDAGLVTPATNRYTPDHRSIIRQSRTGIVVYAGAPSALYPSERSIGHQRANERLNSGIITREPAGQVAGK
jgi:hypothetical protein